MAGLVDPVPILGNPKGTKIKQINNINNIIVE
jgi:hypothetical protein